MWWRSNETVAGEASAGVVWARSDHREVRAKPWAPAPAPGAAGESAGLPNQGRHRGMPPRIARVPSITAREESQRMSECPAGRHDSRWAPKGVTRAEHEGISTLSVAMSVMVIS